MLQWMGGSRRKVTTSRKSTQKRQKQYFEQRKRQQQETAFTENNIDDLNTYDHQKKNRSLDILSLLNVSKVTEECRPLRGVEGLSSMTNKATCASSVKDVDSSLIEKSGGHAFSASYYTSTSSPIITTSELTATECTLPTGTRVPSLHQMGRVSSKSTRENSTSEVKNIESEYVKGASAIQPSIFDIIGDDGAIGASEGDHVQEAHVAFSIEGLGKVGTETPLQSPQHPGSMLNGEQPSFTKAAKNINSCKKFSTMLDDLEMEVECLMQDVEKPSRHNRLLGDGLYPISSIKHELLTFKDGMQLEGRQCEINSLYDEDRHDNFWNDCSPCLDNYQVDEKCGVNWKKCDATKSSFTRRNNVSDFKFESCYSQSHPRCQERIPDRFDNLDGDCRFPASDEPKYSSFVRDYHSQDRSSPFEKLKDTRDSLTSFSGESCSSTAVEGESTADLPSARHTRRYGKDLDMPSKSNDYDEGMWNMMPTTLRQREECHPSWKSMRSGSSHSRSALFSRAPVNECEGYHLFEQEFPLPKMNTHHGSFFTSFEKNQHWTGDSFSLDTATEFHRSKCFFDGSAKDTPNEFSFENFAFHQPFCSRQSCNTSFNSKAVYGGSSPGAHDSEVHVQSSNSSEVFEDIESAFPAPELSAQGSVTEEGGYRSQSQPPCPEKRVRVSTEDKNMTPESRLPTQETTLKGYSGSHNMPITGISQEVTAHALGANTDYVSDNEQNSPTKESLGSIPVLCRQKVKVCVDDVSCFTGKDVDDDNLKEPEPKTMLIDPCFQLMTVERCVLKLLTMPK